mgnify:FL=1
MIQRLNHEPVNMQVVILAGGVGSRLSPWTKSVPKPLLPMLDRTLLEQVIHTIPNNLIDEVIVAGGYKVDMIKSYFDSIESEFDVNIVNETEPLGTGGALGNCKDSVSGTFACFNGDIISSLDIGKLLELHNKNGGVGSLGLWEVEDPTRFGIVGVDSSHKITQFKEKPKPEEVFSNLINAGSYIFEDDIFDFMPRGRHSLERDVFPQLTDTRMLNGMQFDGYFIDAGTRESWCDAVSKCVDESRFTKGLKSTNSWFSSAKDTPKDSIIASSMISSGVEIMQSSIRDSTILSNSKIGTLSQISGSLIGRNSIIGENSRLTNVIVGHDSVIPPGTTIKDTTWENQ